MRLRGTPITNGADVFGDAPEEEYTFLLVPMRTYELLYQLAREQGISMAELWQDAALEYVENRRSRAVASSSPSRSREELGEPDFVVTKRR